MTEIQEIFRKIEDVPDFQQIVFNNLIVELNKSKNDIIKSKLKEMGVDFNWDGEEKRLFKSLIKVNNIDGETWFYNDGTLNGKRIITFKFLISRENGGLENSVRIGLTYF